MQYILHANHIRLARCDGCGVFLLVSRSFEPLAPEPEVVHQLAKGTKEKSQTQGDEEYGERQNENRRDAAAFISLNRGPCCAT